MSYKEVYEASMADPNGFWLAETKANVAWRVEPTLGLQGSFYDVTDAPISWFADGTLP